MTYDEMLNGRSVLRNRVIANVFSQMGLIEAWGTGIRRIREEAAKYRLRDPEFLEFDDMFRINLYRYTDDANKTPEKHRKNIGKASEKNLESAAKELNNSQKGIVAVISLDGRITATELAEKIGISRRNIEENIRALKEMGILVRRGGRKEGYWEVVSDEE